MLESLETEDTAPEPETEPDVNVMYGAFREQVTYTNDDVYAQDIEGATLTKVLAARKDALEKQFKGVGGAGSKAAHEKEFVTGYDLMEVARPALNIDYLMKMYQGDHADYTNYAAINAKVANVAGLGYDFIESPKTLEKEDKIDDDSERMQTFRRNLARARRNMFEKLDSLNEEDEFIETIEKVVVDYEASGNGYLEIGRTNSGEIGYVGHIPAQTIRVRKRRDGFVQFINGKPVFFRRYGDRKTRDPFNGDSKPNEIIHFKKYNPTDNYYGAPDIIPALKAVAGNKFSDEYNLDFFENKAVPRNIIIVRGGKFDEAAQAKLLRFFGEDLRGSHHRALFVPLPADTKDAKHDIEVRSVETGIQDSAFREYTRGNIEKILMVHRVPSSKLGMTGDNALAAAKDLDKTFKEQVCRPLQRVIEKKINKVIAEITDIFTFKLNELDLVDEVAQASIDQTYFGMGALTGNEMRAKQGMTGLTGGDRTIWDINDDAATKAAAAAKRSEAKSQATSSRTRDQTRPARRTDSVGGARNPKGEGRTNKK